MTIRELNEARESGYLSSYAQLSQKSRGRMRVDELCPVRTIFQHDRDRILHSKSFRRLKHKTQVFLSPEGDHYRTRLTHTLEVSQIARTVARALCLNEDLVEAVALGHDLGHTPFGHAGERVLNDLVPGGFRHAKQGLRVVDHLEKDGAGLNLSWEVRLGILWHSKGGAGLRLSETPDGPLSREAQIVRYADLIAYVSHDLDDAVRGGVIATGDVPRETVDVIGAGHSQRIGTMVRDLIETSLSTAALDIVWSSEMEAAVRGLRGWLDRAVYHNEKVHADFLKASRILRELFGYFMENEARLKAEGGLRLPEEPLAVSVADFIAGMTDRFALTLYDRLFMPKAWKGF